MSLSPFMCFFIFYFLFFLSMLHRNIPFIKTSVLEKCLQIAIFPAPSLPHKHDMELKSLPSLLWSYQYHSIRPYLLVVCLSSLLQLTCLDIEFRSITSYVSLSPLYVFFFFFLSSLQQCPYIFLRETFACRSSR